MKIGFGIPNNQGFEDPNDLIALAVEAERSGCNSVWVREHLFHSSYVAERLGNRPYYDALTILTAIACATEKVKLGTSVLVLPWHDPPRLGKMVATLDQLSGGRVCLGVGVATTRDEFENLGVDFASRGKRTNEILGALQALWTQDTPAFEGEFYRYSGLKFSPKPKQKPYPPILVGGASLPAKRRVAKYGDGWHTLRQSPRQVAEGRREIVELTEIEGRDPTQLRYSITVALRFSDTAPSEPVHDRMTLSGEPEEIAETVRAYRDAGIDEIVVGIGGADPANHVATMTRFMQEVMPIV